MKKILSVLLMVVLALSLVAFAEDTNAIEISTVEELMAITDDLAGDYILTEDIDLGGAEWEPIGQFVPAGESEEESETPSDEYAFTGTFDGNGHTISNYKISQPEDGYSLGLFGCISAATISNLNVENASVEGCMMIGAVIGYSFSSVVENVALNGSTVTGYFSDALGGCDMIGGVVGASMNSTILNCTANADITVPDGAGDAGIVGGGWEVTSVKECTASGTLNAGDNCYGLGGISGCGFGAPYIDSCVAEDLTVTCGENCYWIGGITGYAGGYADYGLEETEVTSCIVRNVVFNTPESCSGIDSIVGSPFSAEEYGEPYSNPTVYTVTDCTVE